MNRKVFTTEEDLKRLYWEQELTQKQIADLFNVKPDAIYELMKALRIPSRNYHDALILSYKDPARKRLGGTGRKASDETREKLSLSHKGQKPWNTGRHWSKEHKEILSLAHAGQISPNKGIPLPEELKERLREAAINRWANLSDEEKKNHLNSILKGQLKRPNKLEQQLISIIESNKLPYKYVGDGQFILGGKNPDFLNVNGKKQLIELFGTYWHDVFDVARRKEYFASYGFDTLVIWEEEMADIDAVISKIKKFSRERVGA